MKYIFALLIILLNTVCYAHFCPDNFRTIQEGESLQTVLDNCGPPVSQNTYEKDTTTNVSVPVGGGQTTATAVPIGNVVHYYSYTQAPTYVNQQVVNKIQITELHYAHYVLQFENGILVHGWPTN